MSWLNDTFGVAKPILAMLHLAALPGDPAYLRDGSMRLVVERARQDLHALQDGGVEVIQPGASFTPDPARHAAYQPYRRLFEQLYHATRDLVHAL